MNRQLVAVLHFAHDRGDIGEIELGVYALGVHVHGQRHDIDIAGTLAVTEQGALDSVGPRHQRQLRRRHAGAAVVVRVHADDQGIALFHMAAEPLDLVGVVVGRSDFDRGWQVDDHFVVDAGAKGVHHRFDDLDREIHLRGGE